MNMDDIGSPIECAFQGRALPDIVRSSRKNLYIGVNKLLRKGSASPIAEIGRFDAETAITKSEISRNPLQTARLKIRGDSKNAHRRHCVERLLVAGRNGLYAPCEIEVRNALITALWQPKCALTQVRGVQSKVKPTSRADAHLPRARWLSISTNNRRFAAPMRSGKNRLMKRRRLR
jgi:hypothetical protein